MVKTFGPSPLMTYAETTQTYKLSRTVLWRMAREDSGEVFLRIGRRRLVDRAAFERRFLRPADRAA